MSTKITTPTMVPVAVRAVSLGAVLAAFLMTANPGFAQDRDKSSHVVTVAINPITAIAVSSSPPPMIIRQGTRSVSETEGYRSVTDQSTTYRLTSNVTGAVIRASLSAPMPEDTQLRIRAESGLGTSLGEVAFSSFAVDRELVSYLDPGLENGRLLTFEFRADTHAEPIPVQSRTLSITLIDPRTGHSDTAFQTISFGVQRADKSPATK